MTYTNLWTPQPPLPPAVIGEGQLGCRAGSGMHVAARQGPLWRWLLLSPRHHSVQRNRRHMACVKDRSSNQSLMMYLVVSQTFKM
jgi:hypothetical protein